MNRVHALPLAGADGAEGRRSLVSRARAARSGSKVAVDMLRTTLARCGETVRVLRRPGGADVAGGSPATAGGPHVDLQSLVVLDEAGRRHILTPTEWRLLRVLAERPGQLVTRGDLAMRLWGLRAERSSELEVYVSRLRRKLGGSRESLIETVRGDGYRLTRPL